jgi:hypothetical protein
MAAPCWCANASRASTSSAAISTTRSRSTHRRWATSAPGAWRDRRQLPAGPAFRDGRSVSLEDFLVNRFGAELYRTFFKDYTEKVWGVPCREITAEWGAQRIKGLSVRRPCAMRWRGCWASGPRDVGTQHQPGRAIPLSAPRAGPDVAGSRAPRGRRRRRAAFRPARDRHPACRARHSPCRPATPGAASTTSTRPRDLDHADQGP